MGNYINSAMLWKDFGKGAYTKVRSEIVGTGNASTSIWDFDHDNVINSSQTLYTGGTAVPTGSYSINLDDGRVSGLTLSAGVTLSADYDYADVADSRIQSLISSSESWIEDKTQRNFVQNTGEVEYLDVESGQNEFFLTNYPVLTLSSVELNTASSEADAPGWSSSTSGLGNDYLANAADLKIGRLRFIDNKPLPGKDRMKITYNWGYTSTPPLVIELALLVAKRKMAYDSVYKSIFKGYDEFNPIRLDEINTRINELINELKKQSFELA